MHEVRALFTCLVRVVEPPDSLPWFICQQKMSLPMERVGQSYPAFQTFNVWHTLKLVLADEDHE
jgi:hypothetical protein